MFSLFSKREERVKIQGMDIYIDNRRRNVGRETEINFVFQFMQSNPELKVFENLKLKRCFKIETLKSNPDLTGQFLHASIRIQANSAVMIDGVISDNALNCLDWKVDEYEAIRFQPFYLSNKEELNKLLIGKGLFERGLHFKGVVTPKGVRCICTCDNCSQSFTLQHFHAGFSEVQYFYSSDSAETLLVPYHALSEMPTQFQEHIELEKIEKVENVLPRPSNNHGAFRYYNSFKCPYCLSAFIDFDKYKEIRIGEYYGNTHINKEPVSWES